MFNLAIDSKLRGCDVVASKVEDVAPHGYAADRTTVRQRKTGRPVRFELTDQTRQALDEYIRVTNKKSGEYLFVGRRGQGQCMTTRQYARLVGEWIASIGLDPLRFATQLLEAHEANVDLPPHREFARGPTFAWPSEGGKHGALPRHRGRRRIGDSRTS